MADRIDMAERIRWQIQATGLLSKLLDHAARAGLPAIRWSVTPAGSGLHGECVAPPGPLRREHFTAWRDALTGLAGEHAYTEHNLPGGEIRLLAHWKHVPATLDASQQYPAVRITLTASIWDDEEQSADG